jgi:hypothetical protein
MCAIHNPRLVKLRLVSCGKASTSEAQRAINHLITLSQSLLYLEDGLGARETVVGNQWGGRIEFDSDEESLWGESDFSSSEDYWESSDASIILSDSSETDNDEDDN